MEVTGRIIVDLPEVSGTSRTGNPWKKKEYVLETHDQYPRKVHFGFFGDRCDQYRLQVGQEVTVSFDIESREFNGRWYTDIRAWKAEQAGAQPVAGQPTPPPAVQAAPAAPAAPAPAAPTFDAPTNTGAPATDDLPF